MLKRGLRSASSAQDIHDIGTLHTDAAATDGEFLIATATGQTDVLQETIIDLAGEAPQPEGSGSERSDHFAFLTDHGDPDGGTSDSGVRFQAPPAEQQQDNGGSAPIHAASVPITLVYGGTPVGPADSDSEPAPQGAEAAGLASGAAGAVVQTYSYDGEMFALYSGGNGGGIGDIGGGGNGITGSINGYSTFSSMTGNNAIDQTLLGAKWGGALGTGVTITYSFLFDGSSYFDNVSSYPGGQEMTNAYACGTVLQAAITDALNFYGSVCNINFVYVQESASQAGDLRFGRTSYDTPTAKVKDFPGGLIDGANANDGDVWFGTGYNYLWDNATKGTYGYATAIHEIGHALGLKHPHNVINGYPLGSTANDSLKTSIMSYKDHVGDTHDGYGSDYLPTSAMIGDIAALQYMYGANNNGNAGNTTYTFVNGEKYFRTIWDGNGTDTFNCGSMSQAVSINLNAGAASSIGLAVNHEDGFIDNSNVFIAYNVIIENAVGGSAGDTILGNNANNRLTGGLGNDNINGSGGIDTAVFSGLRSAYTVTKLSAGNAIVTGADGTDTVTSIEFLAFADQTVSLSNDAPVANIADHGQHTNTYSQINGWLSYSDANGNPAVYYQFIDNGTAANSNKFWIQGLGFQTAGTTITVAAADLAKVWVGGATAPVTDTMWVRAFDGTDWSAWDSFNVSGTNAAPVAAINNHTLHTGTYMQVQNWLSYTDAESDAAVRYEFVDLGAGAGSSRFWTPNGFHASGPTLSVAAADLDDVWVGGATAVGTDQMWVRAFDGVSWSAWDSFNLNATNAAPVATISDRSLHVGNWAQVQNWLSYSDGDGDPAVRYEFVDLGAAAGSGRFWTPWGGYHASGPTLSVAASDLKDVYVGGAVNAGTDQMWVRAFDGTSWSTWDSFNFTATNTTPVATINNQTLAVNQWAQASNWVNYSDGDGDAATLYEFVDLGATAGSGQFWTPSGGYHASGPTLQVAAANLSDVWIGGATVTGTDQMWVRAFDGHAWSAWDSFTLTTA